jgi:hypothetical protein
MTSIGGPVGIRNRTQQVKNAVADQVAIIGLLSRIAPVDGGQRGLWITPPLPGPAGQCPRPLADAIRSFQEVWRTRGELRSADGVVDPSGGTHRKLDACAASDVSISFRQTNPESLTREHEVMQMVISPLSLGDLLQEVPQTGSIREFLFEMRKDGAVYWIGAAVPKGTSAFTKIQVFFHPTVKQQGVVHAAEGDYPAFRGGWSDSLQRYVAMQGGQLAGARQTPLIVPFMTMAAFSGGAPAYMFATRPTETLNAIMTAVRDAVASPGTADPVKVSQIGVSSFSSGIGAMRLFIQTFGGSGLIAETTDFDGPRIISEPKRITRSPGAVGRVFSQVAPPHPQLGWVTMPASSFRNIRTFRKDGPHAQIGWMTFFMASLASVIV